MVKSSNSNLRSAKKGKNDEFYTQLSDIEKELRHYKKHFEGKIVLCNCDDARESNFFKFFSLKFEDWKLRKLICIGYKAGGKGVLYIYEGDKNGNKIVDDEEIQVIPMEGDGDFRSQESIEILKSADIICTNPPFSLFREYVAQLVEYGKKFLIIGNMNAISYKEIFPLIKDNKLWCGMGQFSGSRFFSVPDTYESKNAVVVDGVRLIPVKSIWFTNLDHHKRSEELVLYKKYTPEEYPKFDNYDAINVNKIADIPMDYDGVMGVPITFLEKYNPQQFEIIGGFNGYKESDEKNGLICGNETPYFDKNGVLKKWTGPTINQKTVYYRILIHKTK